MLLKLKRIELKFKTGVWRLKGLWASLVEWYFGAGLREVVITCSKKKNSRTSTSICWVFVNYFKTPHTDKFVFSQKSRNQKWYSPIIPQKCITTSWEEYWVPSWIGTVFGSPGGVGGVLVEHRAISVADCQHKKLLTAEGSLPFYMFLHLHIILLSTHFHLANNAFFLVPEFPSSMNHSYL